MYFKYIVALPKWQAGGWSADATFKNHTFERHFSGERETELWVHSLTLNDSLIGQPSCLWSEQHCFPVLGKLKPILIGDSDCDCCPLQASPVERTDQQPIRAVLPEAEPCVQSICRPPLM